MSEERFLVSPPCEVVFDQNFKPFASGFSFTEEDLEIWGDKEFMLKGVGKIKFLLSTEELLNYPHDAFTTLIEDEGRIIARPFNPKLHIFSVEVDITENLLFNPNFKCEVSIGGIKFVSKNSWNGLDQVEEVAVFEEWLQPSNQKHSGIVLTPDNLNILSHFNIKFI